MKAEKSFLPLHPASIGGENELNSETTKNKNFHLSLAGSKLLLTFALPIARKGFKRKKSRLVTAALSLQLEVVHVL
ncbi:hypothetical protein KB206_16595 [Microvirga sp. STS02]|uniref:hypothetical protein n=1 Tax=Hymenobacter negativus TaxID=2795026 RepID=UPI0018DC25D0|nr:MULTISPECIES: hypothetical protein [Bacteria]MBH8570512.1 hypothetical protein [Hymenobacter negativus]MBR7210251.1 hypothetical protein [Microvirga sp. STS02]